MPSATLLNAAVTESDDGKDKSIEVGTKRTSKRAKSPTKSSKSKAKKAKVEEEDSAVKTPKKRAAKGTNKVRGKSTKKVDLPSNDEDSDSGGKAKKSPAKKKKAKAHQVITERDDIPKLWTDAMAEANGSYTFRIASWNVAGLRALVKKEPAALADLCKQHNLDMLCLQETKLQESHIDDSKLNFRGCLKDEGYDDYWSCSTAKKGYSGTAVFVKQSGAKRTKSVKQTDIGKFFGSKTKANGNKKKNGNSEGKKESSDERLSCGDVSYGIGKAIDNEGRSITLDFPFATITNVYVPNSGQVLERLDYRTLEWDKDFLAFQQGKEEERGLPVIWLGDLNVAHKAFDIWNDGAKHLAKQAGVTVQERESFQAQLDAGYIDAFRALHPEIKGHYSYWSQRAGNRAPNKGLRLDYFICSSSLFSEDSKVMVRDSYMIPEQMGSDHAPVVLELELKKE